MFYVLFISVFVCVVDCVLYAVGKPVYHKSTNVTYGSWLKDSRPRNKEMDEKIWTTYETESNIIYEFADKASFRNNQANELRLKTPGFQVYIIYMDQCNGCVWRQNERCSTDLNIPIMCVWYLSARAHTLNTLN